MNGARRQIRLLDRDGLDAIPHPKWLIEGLIQSETSMVLYGPPGAGKTFLALDMALCVATGIPFHGRAVQQGAVVYLVGEGVSGLKIRILAWEAEYEQQMKNLYVVPDQPQLLDADDITQLITTIKERKCGEISFIVIDTLSRHFSGDENKSDDMRKLTKVLDHLRGEFDCSTMLIHHPGKNSEVERGSSALRGDVDTMMPVTKKAKGLVCLACNKQRNADEFSDILFALKPTAVRSKEHIYPTCVITAYAGGGRRGSDDHGPQDANDLRDRERKLLLAFADDPEAEYRSTELQEKSGIKDPTYDRARGDLVERGLMEKTQSGRYRLTPLGKSILERVKHREQHQ